LTRGHSIDLTATTRIRRRREWDTSDKGRGCVANSSQGDAFMAAQAEPSVTGDQFKLVALASIR